MMLLNKINLCFLIFFIQVHYSFVQIKQDTSRGVIPFILNPMNLRHHQTNSYLLKKYLKKMMKKNAQLTLYTLTKMPKRKECNIKIIREQIKKKIKLNEFRLS